jgi:hypothetical protein
MKKWISTILTVLLGVFFSLDSFAGFGAYQGTTNLGVFAYLKCSSGLTCTSQGNQLNVTSAPTVGGISGVSGFTNFYGFETGGQMALGSTTASGIAPVSGTIYLTQVYIPFNATLTGVALANSGTTNSAASAIVWLINSNGTPVAHSNLAGQIYNSANAAYTYQSIPFTAQYSAIGPGNYWVGVTVSGATGAFYTAPGNGAYAGLGGSVTGQSWGVVSGSIPLPKTFTGGVAPMIYTY